MITESEKIRARYARRSVCDPDAGSPLTWTACMVRQEKERALLRWIQQCQIAPLAPKTLLEVGCGSGANFLEFLRLGFRAERMMGIDLLPERARAAREMLPARLNILDGDASEVDIPEASYDVVYQSTVFTSILDREYQATLAHNMWSWVRPGGGVLWYDFVYNNPRNSDVRGVPLRRIRELFPQAGMTYWPVTLAPPISRIVTRVHPGLYTAFNRIRSLRTHVLCWMQKG